MKLLEILQKELREFPEGMLYAVQDYDGEVKFAKHSHPTITERGIWYRHEDANCLTILRLELAEDWDSAIVTKDMWEKHRVKQIIVNVSGLSVEEKQRVNEALAKITGFNKMTSNLFMANWIYAPSTYLDDQITYSNGNEPNVNKEPTHTPQQVLEMAGMATNRKVRKDIDLTKEFSVNVSGCTDNEKKQVQQAFFDVGIKWAIGGTEFHYLDAESYSNSATCGSRHGSLRYGTMPRTDSISHQQFLELIYEPEQVGYVHADLMAQYAEDAKTSSKPWELWQIRKGSADWISCTHNPGWDASFEYRRKPRTHLVNGVEVPDLRFAPQEGEAYYLPTPSTTHLFATVTSSSFAAFEKHRITHGLCYEYTEEGKKAAILHAKAWLGTA